ncbi:MAG: DUF3427 domain-containing protein, partial [Syntrophobacter sp.]
FYDFVVIDEAHHGTAASYRPVFEHFKPRILLGLTATPERMDGEDVARDFGNRFAAEVRLPEALEEKLLCPFHYFGIADPVSLDADRFWSGGKYDTAELEKVYTGAHALATQRFRVIHDSLLRYEPDLSLVKGIGFCASVRHARYMAEMFTERGIPSGVLTGETDDETRSTLLQEFRKGSLTFLFTRDVLNEGLDVPEMNTVLFLRPTESLTVFLQQLGRGLRHAPGKDCLTVLDFVGQAHRRYRMDIRLKALLPKTRYSIDREAELDFPHLPAGCSIQLDRLARDYILRNIRENLRHLSVQIPERLQTFENESKQALNFGNFVRYHDYEPELLLAQETWSGWKAKARIAPLPEDPDLGLLKSALVRSAFINGASEIALLRRVIQKLEAHDISGAVREAGESALPLHYRIWAKTGTSLGMTTIHESFERLARNPHILGDIEEILEWASSETRAGGVIPELQSFCTFELHSRYGIADVNAILKGATLESAGQKGVGVLHYRDIKTYALLITYQKTEHEFSPSTMYADFPVSRHLLHWESQSNTRQESETGQNLIHHKERGCRILIFARDVKKRNGVTVPFTFLGPAERVSHESECPVEFVWRLLYPMPVAMFEENRRGG